MPSSWSSSLRFELQFTGENINLWGDKLNAVLQHADYAVAGWLTKALTGDYTLTTANAGDDEARAAMLKFTGALAAGATVTIPSVSKSYFVYNATNKVLTFSTGAGATVSVDAGDKTVVDCDGAAVHTVTFGGLDLKSFISASVLGATGALPAAPGNDGKALIVVGGAWVPTQLTPANLSGLSASASQVRAGTTTGAALTPGDTYNALAEVPLIDAVTVTPDFAAGINFGLLAMSAVGATRQLANPINAKPGQTGYVRYQQDAAGGRALTFGTAWKREGGPAAASTPANSEDYLFYEVITSSKIIYGYVKAPF